MFYIQKKIDEETQNDMLEFIGSEVWNELSP